MWKRTIVYISGKITGNDNYKSEFQEAENFLTELGYIVINPAEIDEIVKCSELDRAEIMSICYRLVDISDAIFMIGGWQKSRGANEELSYARSLGKKVMYQNYYYPFRKEKKDENC